MSDLSLHNELGLGLTDQKDKPNTSREDDVCKKCRGTLRGTISGRPLPAEESTEENNEHAITVTAYCPTCG